MQAIASWLQRFHGLYAPPEEQPPSTQVAAFIAAARPEEEEPYWALLAKLVALGRIEQALQLLGAHSTWAAPYPDQAADRRLYCEVRRICGTQGSGA